MSGGPHYLGLFLGSPLGSLDWPLSFTRSKLTRENASADPQRLARTKSPDAATTPCPGVRRTVLLVRQWARLLWLHPVHRAPPSPGPQHCRKASQRQPNAVMSFQSPTPNMPQCGPLRGDWGLRHVCSTPQHPVPGQSCSGFGPRQPHSTQSQCSLGSEEAPQTSPCSPLELGWAWNLGRSEQGQPVPPRVSAFCY